MINFKDSSWGISCLQQQIRLIFKSKEGVFINSSSI